jgi:dipeptidyl aminopeptidase/acylaminoacyl peptidase
MEKTMENKTILTRVLILILFSLLLTLFVNAQRPSRPAIDEETLEKKGCVTVEESKIKICKYDYLADGKKMEAFTIRPFADEKYPGIVMLSGREGARSSFNFAIIFAKRDFACVVISELGYGKSEGKPDFMGPASIDAFAVGFKKFRREPFVDRKKIGVYGYSRGGMAASLLVLELGKEVKAAVFGAGVYDFKKSYKETKEGIRESITSEIDLTDEAFRERSSILRMNKLKTPVLIIHGENDKNVPVNQALMLRDHLTELKKDFEIVILSDHEHGLLKRNYTTPVIDFFSRKLKGVPAD